METSILLPEYRVQAGCTGLLKWRLVLEKHPRMGYPKGAVILEQGQFTNHLYYIVDGLAEYTYTDPEGGENLIDVLGAGSLICLQPLFCKTAASGTYRTLTRATLVSITAAEMYACIQNDAVLAQELIEEFAEITGGLVRQLYTYTVSAGRRVLEVLLVLARNQLSCHGQPGSCRIPLSQGELARISRTTRVTVTKVLGQLKGLQLVQTSYGGIKVVDFAGLEHLLSGQPPLQPQMIV